MNNHVVVNVICSVLRIVVVIVYMYIHWCGQQMGAVGWLAWLNPCEPVWRWDHAWSSANLRQHSAACMQQFVCSSLHAAACIQQLVLSSMYSIQYIAACMQQLSCVFPQHIQQQKSSKEEKNKKHVFTAPGQRVGEFPGRNWPTSGESSRPGQERLYQPILKITGLILVNN